MRLITKESKIASRPNGFIPKRPRYKGAVIIESAEGIRFSYSQVPLPGSKYDTPSTVDHEGYSTIGHCAIAEAVAELVAETSESVTGRAPTYDELQSSISETDQ